MESLLLIFIYLCVAVGGSSHEDSIGELYWKTVLPNARMPNAIKSLLTSDQSNVLKSSSSSLSSQSPSSPFDNKIASDENQEENVQSILFHYEHYHSFDYSPPIKQKDDTIPLDFLYPASKSNDTPAFGYHDSAGKTPLKKRSNTTIFFMQKDLHLNKRMNLKFADNSPLFFSSSAFLPRQKSDSVPFSSANFPEIFTRLSVNPSSKKAQFIKNTINSCEEPPIKGEEKFCPTSLEAMIDFSLSKLRNITNKVEAISTETVNATTIQRYTINCVKKIGGDYSVVCHKQKYPYAVFYCHKTSATQVYMVSLGGDRGGKAEAVAVCHQDTSAWNPEHMAFVLLKVEPGTVPICHFLPEDHVVWIQN